MDTLPATTTNGHDRVDTSIVCPSARLTMARLTSERRPAMPRNRLFFPLRTCVLTLVTLTLNTCSTADLISGLVASSGTWKVTWLNRSNIP